MDVTPPSDDRAVLRMAEKLSTLLESGGASSSSSYALLLGLLDLCLEKGGKDGTPPNAVSTRELAARVVDLYFPQTAHFEGRVLRQGTTGQAKLVALVAAFRAKHAPQVELFRAARRAPQAYERLLQRVEEQLVQQLLPRLQLVGSEPDEFLFTLDQDDSAWRDERCRARVDDQVRFKPGVAPQLVALSRMLRPLLHRHWVGFVSRVNELRRPELERFLFGCDLGALVQVAPSLYELQRGSCFYCGVGMRGGLAVDHFVPWSRHPDVGLDNLVAAHERCIRHKAEFLADCGHVLRWAEHSVRHRKQLGRIAVELEWPRDAVRSLASLRSVYLQLPDDALLWHIKSELVPLERGLLTDALLIARGP